jgi:ubiquinone/menaquinone biosynthesis C-methylase UbiE
MSTTTISAKEQFDRQATRYDNRWAQWSDESLRRMLELADPQSDWNALDVATGTGYTALAFAPHVAHVTGADVSSGMLAQGAKRAEEQGIANVDWREAPAEALPFVDASFDLVSVRIAPHHFLDVRAFLSEVRRVLKPNGVFVFGDTTVPDNDIETAYWQNAVERARDASHIANLPPQTWRVLAEAAGFTITDLETMTGAIKLTLSDWLEVSGCTGDRAETVRRMFRDAPASARREFQIETTVDGDTSFAWPRVIFRATI